MDYSTLKMPQDSIVFICLGVLSFNWQHRRKLWRSKAWSQLGTLPPIIQGLSGLYPSACFQIQSPITMVCYCSVFAPSTYAFFLLVSQTSKYSTKSNWFLREKIIYIFLLFRFKLYFSLFYLKLCNISFSRK